MKLLLLISILLLTAQAFAQRAVEPVRIALTTSGESGPAAALDRELRAALRKLAEPTENEQRKPVDVVFVNLRVNFDIVITVARLEDTGCVGLVASMVVTGADGKQTQSIHSGRDAIKLAAHLAARLNIRYFQQARRK